MNTVYALFYKDDLAGVYTSYRRAVQALMTRMALPLTGFLSEFDIEFYTDANNNTWMIREVELDEI